MLVRKPVLLIICGLFTLNSFCQRPDKPAGTGSIAGILSDTVTKNGIEFASLALFTLPDSVLITGVMSDEQGNFKIENVPNGRFYLKIKSLGFKEAIISPIVISPETPAVVLGNVWLTNGQQLLDEVEIVEYTEVLETNLDKKIINVEKDLTSTGGTALDLMKNVPSVTVDVEGNVSLRGNSNVRILIDGRPSTMDPATLLQQLPSSMVKQIEVITNPSAKYDPDGVTGIINIVTKKSTRTGFNGSVQLNAGTGSTAPGGGMDNFTVNKYSFNTNLNYKTKKWNFFGSYDGRSNTRWNTNFNSRDLFATDSTNSVTQTGAKMRPGYNHSGKLGADWQINESSFISLSGNLRYENGSSNETIDYHEYFDSDNFISRYDRLNDQTNIEFNYDASLDYKKTFERKGREITANASYSSNDRENITSVSEQYYNSDLSPTGQTPLNETISEVSGNTQITAQLDYIHPMKNEKAGRVETGLKVIARNLFQDLNVLTNNTPTNAVITDYTRTNRFEYNDQVYSAYAIYGNSFKKLKYQGGLRFEQAFTNSRQINLSTEYQRAFYNFFPSVHMRYDLKENHELSASYSKRIQRPSTRQLNPYPDYTDKLTYRIGNPYLNPEYTNSFEAGHTYMKRGFMFATTLFYRKTTDMIYRFRTIDTITGISVVNQINLGTNESFGVEWIYNHPITKWLRFNSNFSAYYTIIRASEELNTNQNENFAYSARVTMNITSPGKLEWQLTGSYRSPNVSPQGIMRPMYSIDIGVKRDFLRKKMSVSFRVSDIFNTMRFAIDMTTPQFISTINHKMETRVANLTLQYNINNGNERKEKKREMDGGGMDFGM
ncbi:MAG: TonB-dependent receptor domain-containing protein [Flavobacteriales bacterium]